ncbi:MAG: GNAT family N-acetyltransferase [Oscillatoriaceae cyanobacterium Prado104]|jgi:ribosomal protein S18 acetylase RimI-like enzyme|nr:GNAT family N-acetyltransferase [Oscillatoriaceae cyanobacterium Prado104]
MKELSIARLTPDEWQKAQASIELFWDVAPSQETIVKFLSNSHHILLSAQLDDLPVGQVIAYILDRWDKNESMLFLYSIDVAETHQRRGIGKALIAAVRKLGRSQGCSEAFVFANESNLPAMQLYQSTGGKRSNPDDVVMFEYD